nr:MAG TPA: hypothetical protein [Caudoviricetes sp.]
MIKGKATIQLFDEKSGEVVKELHEENMITNAVDTILNPPDYIEIGMDSDNDRSFICCVILRETLPILLSVGLLSVATRYPRTATI